MPQLPHDCTGLNDAQCLHADHFFARLSLWRPQPFAAETCVQLARGDAQRKYPLREHERVVMDEYLSERVELRKGSAIKDEQRSPRYTTDWSELLTVG